MGWTYTHRDKGTSVKDFFQQRFGVEILDCAVVKLRTAYMAIRGRDQRVYAVVCLLDYRREDYFNFGYKDMDETMRPFYHECPKRILELLTPIPDNADGYASNNAREWRRQCWDNIRKKTKLPPLKTGTIIKTRQPIKFTDGTSGSLFQVKNGKRLLFSVPDQYLMRAYKISRAKLTSVGYTQA